MRFSFVGLRGRNAGYPAPPTDPDVQFFRIQFFGYTNKFCNFHLSPHILYD